LFERGFLDLAFLDKAKPYSAIATIKTWIGRVDSVEPGQ
jgi:hypothetical protein